MKLRFLLLLSSSVFVGSVLIAAECPFCNDFILHRQRFEKLHSTINDLSEIILMETESFNVIIDSYPIAIGHLLIIPKKHTTSFAGLDQILKTELSLILLKLKQVFKADSYLLFEHGSHESEEKGVSCGESVFHAHLHFIPSLVANEEMIINLFESEVPELGKIHVDVSDEYPGDIKLIDFLKSHVADLSIKNTNPFSYLFIQFSDRAMIILRSCAATKVSSLRKIFAIVADGKNAFWDWKNEINEEDQRKLRDRVNQTRELWKDN